VAEGGAKQGMAGIQSVAADVFLSYASPDIAIADAVCGALESEHLSCWIAPRDVVPGEFYADSIVRAIDAARVFVVVLSEHAVASPHVIREIERATLQRCPVVTLRLVPKALPAALEYFLNASHWLDASASGVVTALPRLVAEVKRLTDRGAEPIDVPAARRGTSEATRVANSIAVLPFANMSSGPDQEYFSDGLAKEIINLLAHIPGLKVSARTSAFAFRGKEQDIREIADVLGVTHILEGSVRRCGARGATAAQWTGSGIPVPGADPACRRDAWWRTCPRALSPALRRHGSRSGLGGEGN
jgi:adenylate cyclase